MKSPVVTIWRAAAVSGAAVALSLAALPGARPAAADAAGGLLRGLDISAYQHDKTPINWELLTRQGVRFIAVKVSEGAYYRNPYYPSDARAAAAAGLQVMPYAFANPSRSGGPASAAFAVRTIGRPGAAGRPGPASLPLVVDLENDPYKKGTDCYGVGVTAMTSWIAGFTGQVHALTGKWPVIYTTAAWWRECTGSTSRFRHDPLWLAAFGGTRPTVPSPWAHWTFWQYDNAGFLPGIGQTDLDYYQPTSGLPALRPLTTPRPGQRHAAAAAKRGRYHKAAHKSSPRNGPKTKIKTKIKAKAKAAPKREHALSSKHGLKSKHGPNPGHRLGSAKHKHRRPVSRTYPGKFR